MGSTIVPHQHKMARDPRDKFVCYRDNGLPKNQYHEIIQILAGHILKIIVLIDRQEWDDANEALNKHEIARQCGIRISSPFKVCDSVDSATTFVQNKAMWYPGKMRLALPQVAIGIKGMSDSEWKYPSELSLLAERIFPIWLEEWIHAFQYFIAGPVSEKTIAFEQSRYFQNTWDAKEVDIYAIYRDLGWNKNILQQTEQSYDERIAFAKMYKKETSCCIFFL